VRHASFFLVWYWLPVVLWMGLIFFLSSQPSLPRAPDDVLDVLMKKSAHFAEYFMLAALLSRAVSARWTLDWRATALVFGIVVAYAISDEFHQRFVSGRTPSPWDVGIDALGAVAALALLRLLRRQTLKRTLITSPSRTM
jgi:VanZ family protein